MKLKDAAEMAKMKNSKKELARCHRKQRRYKDELQEVDNDLRFWQAKSEEQKQRFMENIQRKSIDLDNMRDLNEEVAQRLKFDTIRIDKKERLLEQKEFE